jgi:hypothetical protein
MSVGVRGQDGANPSPADASGLLQAISDLEFVRDQDLGVAQTEKHLAPLAA